MPNFSHIRKFLEYTLDEARAKSRKIPCDIAEYEDVGDFNLQEICLLKFLKNRLTRSK